MSKSPPKAILLDVNGTLFPVTAAEPAFKELGLDPSLLEVRIQGAGNAPLGENFQPCQTASFPLPSLQPHHPSPLRSLQLWFAHVLRDAVCAQLSGVFAPFKDFAGHHLVTFAKAAQRDPTSSAPFTAEDAASKIAAAWKAAEPFPDVAPGLSQIHVAGIQIAALTNGSRDIAAAVLERASFTDLPVFDITEAKAWKPDRNSYAFAANSLLIRPSEMMMVAAHPWDCFGAMQVGR